MKKFEIEYNDKWGNGQTRTVQAKDKFEALKIVEGAYSVKEI